MVQEFTDSNFAEFLQQDKPVVVDFWAEWCGPCKMMLPVVDELAAEYEGRVIVGKMNVDDNDETPAEFGIMNIPTMLFFKDGQLINKHVGACPKAELKKVFDAILA